MRSSSIVVNALLLLNGTTSLLALPFAASILPLAMAVDHSKFRTCQQTSFCRRHRHGKSKRLYDYRVVGESVLVHRDNGAGVVGAGAGAGVVDKNAGGGGLLSKFSRKLMGGRSDNPPTEGDATIRGPSPIFTAKLANVAPFTSTALTAQAYGNGNCNSQNDFGEELNLAVHLHEDGVARIRITEVLEEGVIRSTPRWTSDELVLNEKEMIGVNEESVQVMSTNPSIMEKLSLGNEEKSNSRDVVEGVVSSLAKRANMKDHSTDNFIVLSYGPSGQKQWQLMLQLEPFAVYFFRGNDDGPPMIVAGTGGLTHFEIRRSKECSGVEGGDGDSKRKLTEKNVDDFDVELGDDEEEGEEVDDRHGGKEIVGYWEDGLAIYADGTREEAREETPSTTEDGADDEELGMDKGEGREQRRLDEEDYDTEDMWEEKFGEHTDSKPFGPMSVGMELTFPASNHLFGLPEHASSTQLKTTVGSDGHHYYKEPYRLYNLDVFEYDLDETMALYGHIPLVVSQSMKTGTAGAFWFNPTETFVDIEETAQVGNVESASKTHFMSESGIVDLFLMPGPDPAALYEQYARLTGRMPLPPMFSLGYHQCRWNYRDEADVYQVHSKFEELDYPYDVLWLDIEHTDGKRYFTWDDKTFPHPKEMQKKLGGDGRRMVTIVDPHIKRDNNYYIHKEATSLGLYIKDKNGEKDFDGWCWPGSSSYLDFTTEKVRNWWADQFHYNKYKGSTPELFTWNDMNEPSVFNGPEITMQKDLLNLNKIEHREWHSLYGMLFQRSTTEGLIQRNEGENVRPFVLSRAFFAGSQRYGAIWTGDNEAKWSHLEIAAPMLLGLNVGALSFVGADVGGFFGNTDAELMTRWMQAGAYQPFFRGHAHHDAKRREPWMFGDETMVRLRRAAMARYALLPFWYTVFWQAGTTGMPVMRTMWMQYPKIPELYSVDDQYLIGSDLLIKPVTSAGATTSEIQFPLSDCWYDVDTMQRMKLNGNGNTSAAITVDSDIDKIPVYQRGGSIIARKLRLRRSSHLMMNDPYTLYVALGNDLKADGTLYMDDETTFDHEKQQDFGVASFSSSWGDNIAIQNSVHIGSDDTINAKATTDRIVERIVVMGVPAEPREIRLKSANSAKATSMEFQYDDSSKILVIRKPGVSALEEWIMEI
mmetsp:Transcript_13615/g.29620  ORF Transcript_13615/g.29620 Transcript_13615/m.29620 type:complete len:1155 (-) Transcript_13615:134-3598(-)